MCVCLAISTHHIKQIHDIFTTFVSFVSCAQAKPKSIAISTLPSTAQPAMPAKKAMAPDTATTIKEPLLRPTSAAEPAMR